jgi:hypothetical protein
MATKKRNDFIHLPQPNDISIGVLIKKAIEKGRINPMPDIRDTKPELTVTRKQI